MPRTPKQTNDGGHPKESAYPPVSICLPIKSRAQKKKRSSKTNIPEYPASKEKEMRIIEKEGLDILGFARRDILGNICDLGEIYNTDTYNIGRPERFPAEAQIFSPLGKRFIRPTKSGRWQSAIRRLGKQLGKTLAGGTCRDISPACHRENGAQKTATIKNTRVKILIRSAAQNPDFCSLIDRPTSLLNISVRKTLSIQRIPELVMEFNF